MNTSWTQPPPGLMWHVPLRDAFPVIIAITAITYQHLIRSVVTLPPATHPARNVLVRRFLVSVTCTLFALRPARSERSAINPEGYGLASTKRDLPVKRRVTEGMEALEAIPPSKILFQPSLRNPFIQLAAKQRGGELMNEDVQNRRELRFVPSIPEYPRQYVRQSSLSVFLPVCLYSFCFCCCHF